MSEEISVARRPKVTISHVFMLSTTPISTVQIFPWAKSVNPLVRLQCHLSNTVCQYAVDMPVPIEHASSSMWLFQDGFQ